ncbi:hypothetical protein FSP39_014063 [Pinctada imbricata]|uniref:Protein dopey-1 n=1 Tax=Pinctada imbricata TaxID=66713 RepID=A0AA89C3F3_PINIB|nr:hypothetical protein FSP39_014063 [Pinctada imbricata]
MSALTILAEECELLNDSKYRSYINQVEKALKSFEYTSEWADLISALGKLNKVLVGNTKYPVIPKRVTIGKRLAQCLHPALPSGVHLKALETYDIILKCIGTARLAQDLFIYSAGLFPLLGHAAMSVKPVLLTIYERHFVLLGKHIKPGLNGLLLGLLPGLEEGSEFYDRTTLLLDDFSESVEAEYFYTCLWECVMSCPSVRLPAISYLLAHYNKKQSMEDQLYMMGLNIDLMVEAVCKAIQDTNVLVQRSLLDFLLLAFPMHNGQLTKSDMAKIVQAVVNVVLRRDMSLNRRLYSWLLGSNVPNASAIASQSESTKHLSRSDSVSTSSEMDLTYFQTFSRDLLILALKLKLAAENEDEEDDGKFSGKLSVLKPFRILMSLLDKPEIGPVILESVLLSVFRCLYRECGGQSKAGKDNTSSHATFTHKRENVSSDKTHTELIKTANLLFAAFEPYFIWDYIARLFEVSCCSQPASRKLSRATSKKDDLPPSIQELCTLVDFLVEIVSLETFLETQTEHLPDLLQRVISALSANCDSIADEEVRCVLTMCSKLLSKVQPSMNAIGLETTYDEEDEVPDTFPEKSEPLAIDTESADLGLLNVQASKTEDLDHSSCPDSAPNSERVDTVFVNNESKSNFEEEKPKGNPGLAVYKDRLKRTFSSSSRNQQFTLMQSCVESYQQFFNLYTVKRIIKDAAVIEKFISRINKQEETTQSYDSDSVLDSASDYGVDDACPAFTSAKPTWTISSQSETMHDEETVLTYKCACKLLMDFSSFPIYCTDYHKVLKRTQSKGKVLAETVWTFLDSSCSVYHQKAVELFYLLHQVAPSTWVCEDVIGKSLVTDDEVSRIEAYKRFATLWHLTRDMRSDASPGHSPRTFDRSMFVVLDSLKEDSSPVKTISSTWLSHTVQRNDLSRVLNPLLMMLLHPDTARVSVQHVHIHKPRSVRVSESSEDSSEAKIYAISSDGGNIIYHRSTENRKIGQKSTDDVRSMALVTSSQGATSVTKANQHSEQEFSFDRVQPDNLNLRINPWGSENSLDRSSDCFDLTPNIPSVTVGGAKRLDKETCEKEGIYFDGQDPGQAEEGVDSTNPEEMQESEDTVEAIVKDILDTLLSQVTGCETLTNENSTNTERDKHLPVERAESVISKTSSMLEDRDILISIDKRGMEMDSPTGSEMDLTKDEEGQVKYSTDVHPLHMHMLLYTQTYDFRRTLYALTTLKSILVTCPRQVVTSMVTTSISSIRTSLLAKLQMLLARHRKSVFGKNFFGVLPAEVISNYRSNMFIEIIISVCLYFVRSYYPNQTKCCLTMEELNGNKEVHIVAAEVLTLLISELIIIMKESGKNFMSYIKDLLNRCKLQKALLHCCIASVFNARKTSHSDSTLKMTEAIIHYNEAELSQSANETFQVRLLNLLLVTIVLEGQVEKIQGSTDSSTPTHGTEWDRPKVNFYTSLMNAKFHFGKPIVQQGMFISFVLSALKQKHMSHMHHHWISMVTSALPYMGASLTGVVMNVVSQLCRNIEALASEYNTALDSRSSINLPPDHIVTLLEGLTTICHYCLLESSSPVSVGQPVPPSAPGARDNSNTGQIFTNLIHVFNPVSNSKEPSPQRELGPSPVTEARRGLLSIMPRIIACMSSMWSAVRSAETGNNDDHPTWTMGSPKVIRKCVLEFISPISRPHGPHLLAAIGVAWNDTRKKNGAQNKKIMPAACEEQLLLVDLVSAIKVLPTDTLVQIVNKVIKQPPQTELGKNKKSVPLEVNMLQFFYAYVQQTSANQLIDSWSSLLTLLRDGMQLSLSPSGKFILLQVLNEFVQKMPSLDDKKNQRELQDITQRLLEMVAMIAGSSLEQTTWLRRNLAVKPGVQNDTPELEEVDTVVEEVKERKVVDPKLTSANDSKYSVQALGILAELMAPLLDVVYSSEEKEKVASFLTTVLYNVFPYLRNHSVNNLPSFRACSQILSSISSYQYSRKSWKKDALELLLDTSFFQMDIKSIGFWRCIVDNLMTHDKTTFKDLMNRVTITQSGSLNLFSSKEQELEQRAIMLKRLAFTIFCSDSDQYQKSMPDIQERLAESLRVPHQAPSIMAHVFLCVRVLILRMSAHQLTSLWPTVITEMVHVFMQIEQELSNDTDEFQTSIQRIAALDSSWAHLGNGLNAHNNPAWLQLYLSVCKLLDLALALPADEIPQFQLYRWAFIGGAATGKDNSEDKNEEEVEEEEDMMREKGDKKGGRQRKTKQQTTKKQHKFTPHIIRITKLINQRVGGTTPLLKQTPGRPLLTQTYIRSLAELQPFFNTLCCASQSEQNMMIANHKPGHPGTKKSKQLDPELMNGNLPKSKSTPAKMDKYAKVSQTESLSSRQDQHYKQYIEDIIERDFLEQCPL